MSGSNVLPRLPAPSGAVPSWRRLVDQHLGYVRAVARREWHRLGCRVELGDLVAYGVLGLVDAAQRFDAERGLSFLTFAHHRILGAMLDGLRQLDGGPRRLPGMPSESRARWVEYSGDVDHHPSGRPSQEALLLAAETQEGLRQALMRLPPREREILRARYLDGRTLDEAGARLGLSRSWTCRLHARAVERLRKHLCATR